MNQGTNRDLARDMSSGKVGEVMDENHNGTLLYLHPVGGGLEWEVKTEHVEIIERAQTPADAHV